MNQDPEKSILHLPKAESLPPHHTTQAGIELRASCITVESYISP